MVSKKLSIFALKYILMLAQVNHVAATAIRSTQNLQSQPAISRTLMIGHPTIAVWHLRPLNLLTNAARCQLEISTSCLNFGQLVSHRMMMLRHFQITWIFAKQLMRHLLEIFRGKASHFLTMAHSPMMLQVHHGCKLKTQSGIEILACFSRICSRIQSLRTILTMHHFENMIPKVIVYMKILCRVIGHGSKP